MLVSDQFVVDGNSYAGMYWWSLYLVVSYTSVLKTFIQETVVEVSRFDPSLYCTNAPFPKKIDDAAVYHFQYSWETNFKLLRLLSLNASLSSFNHAHKWSEEKLYNATVEVVGLMPIPPKMNTVANLCPLLDKISVSFWCTILSYKLISRSHNVWMFSLQNSEDSSLCQKIKEDTYSGDTF